MAPFTLEGACHRTGVETGLTPGLIPTFKPSDGAILDHAMWHHGGRRAEVIAAAGCPRLDLPPYSPDLNRIEKCWGLEKSDSSTVLGGGQFAPSDGSRTSASSVLTTLAIAIDLSFDSATPSFSIDNGECEIAIVTVRLIIELILSQSLQDIGEYGLFCLTFQISHRNAL